MKRVNLNAYPEQTQLKMIELLIDNKLPMKADDPKCKDAEESARRFFAEYIPDDIVPAFHHYLYNEGDYILHENYNGGHHYFLILLDGVCMCTYQGKFISYKRKGEILGSVGIALRQAPASPSATVVAYSKEVVLARLEVTDNVREKLRGYLPFMNWMAEDMAGIIISNNAFASLNSNKKLLAAYILCHVQGKDGVVINPSKADIKRALNLSDHSQLNKLIDELIKQGALTDVTEGEKGRGRRVSSYQIHKEVLEEIVNHIDYSSLKDKFAPMI